MSFILSSGWNGFNKLSFWLKVCNSANKKEEKKKKNNNELNNEFFRSLAKGEIFENE